MGRTNWKYVLMDGPAEMQADKRLEVPLWAPTGFKNASIGVQANSACLWAEVDPSAPHRWYRVAIVGTGEDIPSASKEFLGRCALTIPGRTVPAPTENSVQHFYLIEESAEEAAVALTLPKLGPKAGEVIQVPLWFQAAVGNA